MIFGRCHYSLEVSISLVRRVSLLGTRRKRRKGQLWKVERFQISRSDMTSLEKLDLSPEPYHSGNREEPNSGCGFSLQLRKQNSSWS